MTQKLPLFSEMFEGWPVGIAETGPELISIDKDVLKHELALAHVSSEVEDIVFGLRAHGVEIRNASATEAPLNSPEAVALALGITLRPPKDRWITYPLDKNLRRMSAPHKKSGSRYLNAITLKVPSPDELTSAFPDAKVHLLVRNDTTEVLNINGVVRRIELLARSVPLADVVLYDTTDQTQPVVYSLRCFTGAQGLIEVPLEIDPEYEEKVRTIW